jgi:hypothetical protein
MMVLPPIAGVNAGHSAGGGLLDTFRNTISGVTGQGGSPGQVDPGPKGDGSVGLFDGVLKKALFGGAAGAAMGFLPFIPGGPILGGALGALGGAAIGVFSNWSKMRQIKQENEAMVAAMGVQVDHPEIKQVLQSGNVSQLVPMIQSAQQGSPGTEGELTQDELDVLAAQAAAQNPPVVLDASSAGISQSPVPTQGSIAIGSGAGGAINPNAGVDPGIAPARMGGGGIDSAADGVALVSPDQATRSQLTAMIEQLQKQIDMLNQMIEDDERRRADSLAA